MRTLVSKSEYARLKNRTPQAVSNWIASGVITSKALVGSGRRAKICVEQADSDLARQLDPGQQSAQARPANLSINSKTDKPTASEPDEYLVRRRKADAERAEIEAERARGQLAAERGKWLDAEEAQKAWAKQCTKELTAIEQFLGNTLAVDLADEFGLNCKELSVAIRQSWRGYRQTAADRLAEEVERMDQQAEGVSGAAK